MNLLKFNICCWPGLMLFISLFLFMGFLFSCSPKGSYQVLTFFFDGVPDTLTIGAADTLGRQDTTRETWDIVSNNENFYNHQPYLKQQCDACHDKSSRGRTIKPQPELCYQCHNNYKSEYQYLHGPVSGGYCTECHSPHMSKLPGLLRKSGRELCMSCHAETHHDKSITMANTGSEDCLRCHLPHGSNKKQLLK